MDRDQVIARLASHATELRQLGIDHLYLFGSTACGDARPDSDVDPVFDHKRGRLGLFQLMAVKKRADAILGCKTDVMTRRSLHLPLRKRTEASAMQVF